MKFNYLLLISLFLLPLQSQIFSQTELEENLDQMMEWFGGEFNNFQQVWKEKEDSVGEDLIHEHIHSIFSHVEIPALGENIYYVKQYMDNDPTNVYRQRIYSFHPNAEEDAIQLDIYSFQTPEEEAKYVDAHLAPESLKNLKKSMLRTMPGCEVFWKKEGESFIGYMKEKACNFLSRRSGKRIFITDSLQLTQDEIWIRDEAYDEDGKYVFGHKGGIHHKLRRTRKFNGWFVIQKEEGKEEYYVMRNIELHDQGDKVQMETADGEKAPYWVELSEVVYSSGLEVMKLAIYEEGKPRAIAYTWTNVEAKRIGINMRSIQAGFSLVE
ncbi:MAG: chromophore lyase CpcT/CpeT [Bacteroidota bacterium]